MGNQEMSHSQAVEMKRQEDLLAAIAALGGKGMKEEDIVYTGSKLVLPERWRGNLAAAVLYLREKIKEEDELSNFSRTFNYRPWDGAYNAFQAMKKAFGMVVGKPIQTMFGPEPPQYVQVPISITETEEVPWGDFTVPILTNSTISFGGQNTSDFGPVFRIQITAPRKHRFIIEGLFKLIKEELEANSIYRGKAVDGQIQPNFVDLRGFDPNKVVYSDQVTADLEAQIFSVMRHQAANEALGLPTKRAVLLTGPYGTGKTLAAKRTAIEAVDAGWTFLMARPGRDDFRSVLQTASLYQPAVVFLEDAETVAAAANADMISEILDLMDGMQAKNNKIMVVFTTNHPEQLHKGMMRPGRLDAVIEIEALDAHGIERLIKVILGDRLADDVDWERVAEACDGYMPAFVKEAADRVTRYQLSRNNGVIDATKATTEDIVHAASGLRSQFQRMLGAPEFKDTESVGVALNDLVKSAVTKATLKLAAKPDQARFDVWNAEAMSEALNGNN